ncbi:MAG: pyridoxamine 5'-phosphate oxidase family protein [SAR202 cluster bacterium]|jgi:general stress protein 26|nr:pyridoxamine 5'-phosphate oxidase family protein [SAR202 cluster bacterium]MDP6513363.1 pyridoxamine 5'-phosphate oxidase family protein [SAR202 cluster bacterium]MDP6715709.1 pyridoxamine 5'-phosphate oxidase family protein [SAR202 cluster bacterium]
MPPLTTDELRTFLTNQPHLMKLATLTADGWPYVVPVWYDYDGESFTVAGRTRAQWVANIRENHRVSVCIDTYEAPYTRVLMKASAEIIDPAWMPVSPDRAIRYIGEEAGRAYFEQTRNQPRALVRIVPLETTTWTGGGWHPRYAD